MDFVEIHDLEKDLVEGRFHVHEPKKELPIYRGEIPFVLTPGVQFSWDGGRHGHGKGYYDRYLASHDCFVIGLAFDCQRVEGLETDSFDVPLDVLVTEKRIIDANGERANPYGADMP